MTDIVEEPVEPKEAPEPKEVETPTEQEEAPEAPTETPKEEPSEDPAEPAEDAEQSEEQEDTSSEYEQYEDPERRQIVNILKDAKVSVEDAQALFLPAIESKDLSKLDKDAMIEKLGPEKAELVMIMATSYFKGRMAEVDAMTSQVHELAGGEEQWSNIRDWAGEKEKNDPEFAKELNEIRSLLSTETPRAIKAAVKELVELYTADPETTSKANLTVGDKAAGTTVSTEPLSRLAYAQEVEKARKQGTYEKLYPSLQKRRQAGIKQGI